METSNVVLTKPCARPPSCFNSCVSTPLCSADAGSTLSLNARPDVNLCGPMRIRHPCDVVTTSCVCTSHVQSDAMHVVLHSTLSFTMFHLCEFDPLTWTVS